MLEPSDRTGTPLWLADQWEAAEARRRPWKRAAFALAAATWALPSVGVLLLAVVGLVGWPAAERHGLGGLLGGHLGALPALAGALVIEALAGCSFVALAAWAFDSGRRRARAVGVVATVWLQAVGLVWLLIAVAER